MNNKRFIILSILIGIFIKIICFCLTLLFLVFVLYINWNNLFEPNKNNYDDSIFVVTKNERNQSIGYHEINNYGYERKVNNFEYYNNEILYFDNCFESYLGKNKVLNKRTNICKILDANNNEIIIDEKYDDIINNVANLEHDIMYSKIIKTNDNIYVIIALNVNMWSPYRLFKYENNQLNLLYTFDGEDIIAIKEK